MPSSVRLSPTDLLSTTRWSDTKKSGIDAYFSEDNGHTWALRSRPETTGLPVLMVTTRAVKDHVVAAIDAGANDYVVKPFTPQVLKEKIAAIVAGLRQVA